MKTVYKISRLAAYIVVMALVWLHFERKEFQSELLPLSVPILITLVEGAFLSAKSHARIMVFLSALSTGLFVYWAGFNFLLFANSLPASVGDDIGFVIAFRIAPAFILNLFILLIIVIINALQKRKQ